jgi:hypothetical protein
MIMADLAVAWMSQLLPFDVWDSKHRQTALDRHPDP